MTPIVHHIPICPFSQRLEILLELAGRRDAVEFAVVDITRPRDPHILELSGGTTALPVMELDGGKSLKESLVLLDYLEDRFELGTRREDPYERAIENLLVAGEGTLVASGYRLVMNQDRTRREELVQAYLDAHETIDAFLRRHGQDGGPWLFDRFGWAEVVFTPFFRRFAFVAYYEGVDIPDGDPSFDRVREWRAACLEHSAAQQVGDEEVIKLYYDYARGASNGALPEGRERSSFVFEPHWRERPMPPKDKYGPGATDADLGLLG